MKRGYTLVELLVAASASIILITLATGIYVNVNLQVGRGEEEMILAQNGRAVIDRISRDVRQAVNLATVIPFERVDAVDSLEFEDGHNISADGPTYIEYQLENVQNGIGEITRSRHFYYFEGNEGVRLPYNSGTEGQSGFNKEIITVDSYTIADDVQSLEFYGTDNLIKIDVTLQHKANGQTLDLHSAVAKRN